MKIARTGEVDENLHHAVKTVNLVADDIHVPTRIGIYLLKFVLQQL